MRRFRDWPALVLTSSLLGCASTQAAESSQRRHQANRITPEEIQQVQHRNVLDLVQVLRPHWIRSRGPASFTDPTADQVVVYVDGTRAGGAEFLRQIRVSNVALIEYLNASSASTRYGVDHGGGAILVTTRRE